MILTRTPLRVSLLGGGTDMDSFFLHHPGAVISAAVNKSIYIAMNPKFDGRIRVSYSKTEIVERAEDLQHDIVREIVKMFSLRGVEIASISDIPGDGSGLGSSSAFTVGMLRAVYAYSGYSSTPKQLAEAAYTIEHTACGHPCGKQDAYAASCGSLQYYEFRPNCVHTDDFHFTPVQLEALNSRLLLFWTGLRTNGGSEAILKDQERKLQPGHYAEEAGLLLTELTHQLRAQLLEHKFDRLGKFVHASWALKKRFAKGISNDWIEQLVKNALNAGATGAKISGAGGGGFLLVVAEPDVHEAVEKALGLRRVPFKIGAMGSHVVYKD